MSGSSRMNDHHYDIIGDIHGRFDKLEALLERLGYARGDDAGFIPPAGHKALFLGDLIDPKPGHARAGGVRATLEAVKAMCDAGNALCLMGNHELNAIYFHSRGADGKWLRHHGDKNVRMHQGTLDDFPDHHDPAGEWLAVWLPWLKRLPFHLDLGGFRAVHAAWDPEMIARIGGRELADDGFFMAAADKRNPEGEALETLLKGIEIDLPTGRSFVDHTGIARANMRARWWELPAPGIRYDGLVFPANPQIPNDPVEKDGFAPIPGYPLDAVPVFFGHYFKPADAPLMPERANVACLDHSAAKDGPLIAYRWMGEAVIDPRNYVSHEDRDDDPDPADDRPDPQEVVKSMTFLRDLERGMKYEIALGRCLLNDQLYACLTVDEDSMFSDYGFTMHDYVPLNDNDLDEFRSLAPGSSIFYRIQEISRGRDCILTDRGKVGWGDRVFYPTT